MSTEHPRFHGGLAVSGENYNLKLSPQLAWDPSGLPSQRQSPGWTSLSSPAYQSLRNLTP